MLEGSADLFLDFYSGFDSGWAWGSGKSCKYEGGEPNYSRKIVIFVFLALGCKRSGANFSRITVMC